MTNSQELCWFIMLLDSAIDLGTIPGSISWIHRWLHCLEQERLACGDVKAEQAVRRRGYIPYCLSIRCVYGHRIDEIPLSCWRDSLISFGFHLRELHCTI